MNTQTSLAITLAIASLAAAPLPALADQKLLPAQSEISFTSKQMGVPVDGRFRKFDAQVAFEPKKPEAAKISFTVDLAGDQTTASGSFALKRLDFRIGDGDWKDTSMVADAVLVKFKLVLSGVGPL
jgi:polyisoprenoid-binding protein YceI